VSRPLDHTPIDPDPGYPAAMPPYLSLLSASWFAGLPDRIAFVGAGRTGRVTPDRSVDAEGNVAIRFADGVRPVPLAEVRHWPTARDHPGGPERPRGEKVGPAAVTG
jgi:hypothetical protein